MKNKKRPPEASNPDQFLKESLLKELDKQQPDREIALKMLNDLEEKANKQKNARKSSRWLQSTAIVAAVVLVFVFVAPPVLGAENIFELVGRWTKDTFAFEETNGTTDLQHDYVYKTDHPGLQQLYDTVSAYGITERVVPTWLPEGCQLIEVKDTKDINGLGIYAEFESDNETITFFLSPLDGDFINKYPKDDKNVILHEADGIKHYLLQNEDVWLAAWRSNSIGCSLFTNGDKDTICHIIDSIYWEAN